TQKADADKQLNAWMNGEAVDLHQVATSIQKAELSFELAIEVRNKMMQAYQEVMRMQI
ncbi:MAG: flagellar hook-basal body complex protein FliE, partial [Acidobacteriota bacterium]